jgi:hypothetical protein
MGIAGRMTAHCTDHGKPAEALASAADLANMIVDIEAGEILRVDLLLSVMWAQFLVWACGTVLLRLDRSSEKTVVEYLKSARDVITKQQTVVVALAPIEADLPVMAARAGDVDGATKSMRTVIGRRLENFDVTLMGVTIPAPVQLLVAGADRKVSPRRPWWCRCSRCRPPS